MQSGIYSITHTESGRQYVGNSIDLHKRWVHHRWQLNRKKHHSQYLQRVWDVYGKDAFTFNVLELVPAELLLEREQFYLDALRPAFNSSLSASGRPCRITRPCDDCGKDVTRPPSHFVGSHAFCDRACSGKFFGARAAVTGERKGRTYGAEYRARQSQKAKDAATRLQQKGYQKPKWTDEQKQNLRCSKQKFVLEREVRQCARCGREIVRLPSHFPAPPERTFCGTSCRSATISAKVGKAQKGKKRPGCGEKISVALKVAWAHRKQQAASTESAVE